MGKQKTVHSRLLQYIRQEYTLKQPLILEPQGDWTIDLIILKKLLDKIPSSLQYLPLADVVDLLNTSIVEVQDVPIPPKVEVYSHEEVSKAIKNLSHNNPKYHRIISYLWLTHRSMAEISRSLEIQSSTLQRWTTKGLEIILAYLRCGIDSESNTAIEMNPLDIVNLPK
jgi:DNA-directed RNA polymerase specialized sigma24 family protein